MAVEVSLTLPSVLEHYYTLITIKSWIELGMRLGSLRFEVGLGLGSGLRLGLLGCPLTSVFSV